MYALRTADGVTVEEEKKWTAIFPSKQGKRINENECKGVTKPQQYSENLYFGQIVHWRNNNSICSAAVKIERFAFTLRSAKEINE